MPFQHRSTAWLRRRKEHVKERPLQPINTEVSTSIPQRKTRRKITELVVEPTKERTPKRQRKLANNGATLDQRLSRRVFTTEQEQALVEVYRYLLSIPDEEKA